MIVLCDFLAGLEKTLRLLQSLSLIIATNAVTPAAAAPWVLARKQFALGMLLSSSFLETPVP